MSTLQKTTSQDELNILELLTTVSQLDVSSLRQIFLLLARNYYSMPRAFNASAIPVPESYYQYTYSDNIVDPNKTVPSTITIDLTGSSAVNSNDKTDYLRTNNKPAIYVDASDIKFSQFDILNDRVEKAGDTETQGVLATSNIIFSHYANSFDDAAKLSYLTTSHFSAMKDYIKKNLNVYNFQPIILTAPKLAEELSNSDTARKIYRADAIFEIKFESNWRIKEEAVLLKKFAIKLNNVVGVAKALT